MGITLDELLLDANTSNVAISDGTNTLAINGDGSIDVSFAPGASFQLTDGTDTLAINVDGSINAVVSATDLDIRNLAFATDKVDASGSEVSLDAATLAALETITVVATDLDIRDLSFATDSVDASGSNVRTSSDTGIQNTQASVTATAAEVLASPLSGRREVTIQNKGSQPVYIGSSAGVTSANGMEIPKGASATFEWGENVNIFMISASGSQDVRFLESA